MFFFLANSWGLGGDVYVSWKRASNYEGSRQSLVIEQNNSRGGGESDKLKTFLGALAVKGQTELVLHPLSQ